MDKGELLELLKQDRRYRYHIFDSVEQAKEDGYNVVLNFHDYLLKNAKAINDYTIAISNSDSVFLSVESMSDKYYPKYKSVIHTGNEIHVRVNGISERFVEVLAISRLSRYNTIDNHSLPEEMEALRVRFGLEFVRDSEFSGIRIFPNKNSYRGV